MRVAFLPLDTRLASARLRGVIPARQLRKLGFEVDADIRRPADVAVFSKHNWPEELAEGHKRIVFDVCDDHFADQRQAHYRTWCERADIVTCNSTAMKTTIHRETGRDAVVIPDPYESPESPPKCGEPLLWFGNRSNLVDLMPWLPKLPPVVVVSDFDHPAVIKWSPEVMERAFAKCGLVVIPTGRRVAKSANRAVESIRRGIYPVCGPLPAYEALGLGEDISDGVMKALADPAATQWRVAELQDVVREQFSPETIGRLWADALKGLK